MTQKLTNSQPYLCDMHVRAAAYYYLFWHSAARTVKPKQTSYLRHSEQTLNTTTEHVTAQGRAGTVVVFLIYFEVCFVVEGAGRVSETVLLTAVSFCRHSHVELQQRDAIS